MASLQRPPSLWPSRVAELCDGIAPPRSGSRLPTGTAHTRVREELWVLLHGALMRFLRDHAARIGHFHREDLEDLASAKALELLLSAEYGRWSVAGRTPAEIAGYLSTAARNALVDARRTAQREVPFESNGDSFEFDQFDLAPRGTAMLSPGAVLEAQQYADALVTCAESLAPRARHAWLLRVLYDMPTRAIAQHPAVALKAAHVDVILQRCREAMRICMRKKGHDTGVLPAGTFALLWQRCAVHVRELGLEPETPEVVNAQ